MKLKNLLTKINPFKGKGVFKRSWEMAQSNRFLNDWLKSITNINSDLKADLTTIQARCKDSVQNSPFFNKYLSLRQKNIFGDKGITLQSMSRYLYKHPLQQKRLVVIDA